MVSDYKSLREVIQKKTERLCGESEAVDKQTETAVARTEWGLHD